MWFFDRSSEGKRLCCNQSQSSTAVCMFRVIILYSAVFRGIINQFKINGSLFHWPEEEIPVVIRRQRMRAKWNENSESNKLWKVATLEFYDVSWRRKGLNDTISFFFFLILKCINRYQQVNSSIYVYVEKLQ